MRLNLCRLLYSFADIKNVRDIAFLYRTVFRKGCFTEIGIGGKQRFFDCKNSLNHCKKNLGL